MAEIISPIMPLTVKSGRKAATVVSMAETTGGPIRVAAMPAASARGILRFCRRYSVCSPITMASSTTIPNAMIKPKSEIILMVCPMASMTPNVARKATGMPIATQKATRVDRNKKRTRTTRTSPPAPFLTKRLMRSLMRFARTSYCSMTRVSGARARKSSSHSWIVALTSSESLVLPRRNSSSTAV